MQSKELRSGWWLSCFPRHPHAWHPIGAHIVSAFIQIADGISFWTAAHAARQFSSQRDCNGKNMMDTYKDCNPLLGDPSLTHNLNVRCW